MCISSPAWAESLLELINRKHLQLFLDLICLALHVKTVNENLCSFIFMPFKNDIIIAKWANFASVLQHQTDVEQMKSAAHAKHLHLRVLFKESCEHFSPLHPPYFSVQRKVWWLPFSEPSIQQLLNQWSCIEKMYNSDSSRAQIWNPCLMSHGSCCFVLSCQLLSFVQLFSLVIHLNFLSFVNILYMNACWSVCFFVLLVLSNIKNKKSSWGNLHTHIWHKRMLRRLRLQHQSYHVFEIRKTPILIRFFRAFSYHLSALTCVAWMAGHKAVMLTHFGN